VVEAVVLDVGDLIPKDLKVELNSLVVRWAMLSEHSIVDVLHWVGC